MGSGKKLLHVGAHGGAEAPEVVAAFQDGNQAALAMAFGGVPEETGELGKIGVREAETSERVAFPGVESGGNEEEFGLEFVQGRKKGFAEGGEDFRPSGPGGEGAVEDFPGAPALPGFRGVAGAGIPGGLVGGEKEHGAVGVKDLLGAVAVMHVPIHDGDPTDAVPFLRVVGGDGDIVEETKAHGGGGPGVVTGRTHGTEGVVGVAAQDGIDGIKDAADGVEGDVAGFATDADISAGEFGGAFTDRTEGRFDVPRIVAKGDILHRGAAGGKNERGVERIQSGADRRQAFGTLRVAGGRAVVDEQVVEEESGFCHRGRKIARGDALCDFPSGGRLPAGGFTREKDCRKDGPWFSRGMISSLHWGILGTGAIARKFASELPHSATGRLVAVGSRSAEKAAAFAEKFPGVRAHASYEALLADPDVQAVYISTPHPQHAEWAIAAAEAGKHILCEKPLTLNHAEAMVVVEAARRHGVFLMEAFMYRCHPRTARIAGLVRGGIIGRVRLIRAAFSFHSEFHPAGRLFSNELGGGGILDVGCYTTSVARLVAGAAVGKPFQDPVQMNGSAVFYETGVDRVAVATMKFPGDILAEISCGVGLRQAHDLEIFGEEGMISVPAFWNPPGPIRIHQYRGDRITEVETDPNPYKYALEADTVARALPALESPAIGWDDTLGNMRALDEWRRSVKLSYLSESPTAPEQALPVSRRPLRPGRYAEIPRQTLPYLSKPVSRLILGIDNQGTFPHLAAMADDFFERGGNAFDTAHIYGGGLMEELLGHWFARRGTREEAVLIVKGAHTPFCDPENLRRQFVKSLERLQTDYADIYLLHRDNPQVPVGEFVDVLDELRREGKIRAYGGSNWSLGRLRAANDYAARAGREPFRVVSNNLSLARMMAPVWEGCVSAKGPEWTAFLRESGMALFAWSSQARGYFVPDRPADDPEIVRCWDSGENRERRRRAVQLAAEKGVSPINVALAYVLSQPNPTFALFGPRTIAETRTSLPGAGFSLTPKEVAWLDLEIPDRVS